MGSTNVHWLDQSFHWKCSFLTNEASSLKNIPEEELHITVIGSYRQLYRYLLHLMELNFLKAEHFLHQISNMS